MLSDSAHERLRQTPVPRLAGGVLGQVAHFAARTETWALDLRFRFSGPGTPPPLSPEARRLKESHPRAYSFDVGPSPERQEAAEAVKQALQRSASA